MDRRRFLESLAALTSGLLWPNASYGQGEEGGDADRWGRLLPRRRLGRTREPVTMLGVGGWHIGRMDERDAQATIETALEGGVRFFDSAEQYQGGESERHLGRFLTPKYREEVFLMTKTAARDADTARRDLEESLRRLKTDYLDLWQIHAITSPEDVDSRLEGGLLDVLQAAKEKGRVRRIGFTGHTRTAAHRRMLERTEAGTFDACQMPINILDPSRDSFIRRVVPELVDQGVGVLAMKTLANGGFFGGRSHGQHGDQARVVPERASVEEALHFAWSLPVSTVISGPDNPDQMREKVELARSFEAMSQEERERLIQRVADLAEEGVEFYKA